MAALSGESEQKSGNGVAFVNGRPSLLATRPSLLNRRMEFYSWYLMRVSGLLLVVLAM